MPSQGSQIVNTVELLGMDKIHDKLIKIVSHNQHQCQQNNVTLGASLSPVRGLYPLLMAHYDVLSLLFKLLNLILYLKTLNSHLCCFLLRIVIFICFFTYSFDNITLCINLPNVTLSNVSHLVYITRFGETDGVTLSRLGCASKPP